MEITYDTKADALNITFKKGKVRKTLEISPEINLDLDVRGNPLYLEIIGFGEKIGKKQTSEVLIKNLTTARIH
ncbi:DUF2283 domain-containing protein [Patescibacteria group bacterium]|nr:DUF2283 domain-containing protein [Patescibacteria group bacterium]